jgi:hypothetical protein
MSKITIDQVIAETKKLAAQWPTNIYKKPEAEKPFTSMCSYDKGICEPSGGVGCIFGQAFRNLGMELKGSDAIDSILTHNLDIEASHPLMNWCQTVQGHQDNGVTWGHCILLADEVSVADGLIQ